MENANIHSLPVEVIEKRLGEFWIDFKENQAKQGEPIPLPLAVMASNFIPQIPKLLADPERQKDILDFLSMFAWCIGYAAVFDFIGEEDNYTGVPQAKEPAQP